GGSTRRRAVVEPGRRGRRGRRAAEPARRAGRRRRGRTGDEPDAGNSPRREGRRGRPGRRGNTAGRRRGDEDGTHDHGAGRRRRRRTLRPGGQAGRVGRETRTGHPTGADIMIDFRLDDEYEALRKTVHDFAQSEVKPVIGDFYIREEFPYEIVAKMGAMGLFGLPFPEEYGGMGGDYFALCLALEELARVDSSVAVTLEAGVSLGAMPIHRFGTEEQKRRWLPSLCSGEALGAFGLTEPGGGSDAGATKTRAVLDGGDWVINGSKSFITNSGTDITSVVTVTAVTGAKPDGGKEISAILVPSGTPGFTVAPKYSKVGWNCSDTHELAFDDCRVPEENLLGERG